MINIEKYLYICRDKADVIFNSKHYKITNYEKISFIILFSLFVLPIKAQTIPIEYTYDNAGNRVKQKIVDLEYLLQMNDKHSDEIQPYLVDPILSIQATIIGKGNNPIGVNYGMELRYLQGYDNVYPTTIIFIYKKVSIIHFYGPTTY